MSRGCLTITIIPSDVVEGDEVIYLAINEETTMATVEEANTTVMIASDGGNMLLHRPFLEQNRIIKCSISMNCYGLLSCAVANLEQP